MPTILC